MTTDAAAYDDLAGIYDVWTAAAPDAVPCARFYVEEYLRTRWGVVELGVGSGRIAVEAARYGQAVTGIDGSGRMLEKCRSRASAAGVGHLLNLIQADFRDFDLPEPARLIAIPFHTIGHLLTPSDRSRALSCIRRNLAPGGRLIFDHFVFDEARAEVDDGRPRKVATFRDPAAGDRVLWTSATQEPGQRIAIRLWTEPADGGSGGLEMHHHRLTVAWLAPQEIRTLLVESGFEAQALYGDFDRHPFDHASREQVWVAVRPAD